jgi:hypothetical protein
MDQSLSVSLESPQHGFMSLRLRHSSGSFVAVVSHEPYDSLRGLVAALSDLLAGNSRRVVKWNAEPEEFDFQLEVVGDLLRLEVIRYPDHRRLEADSDVVFSYRGSKAAACRAFWEELRDLQGRTAEDEFDRQWRREFPEGELQNLTTALAALKT